jgi:hypothetical protein
MSRDPVTALTTLVLAAFLNERVASAVTFLFFRPSGARRQPEQAARSDWNRQVLSFCVCAILAAVGLFTVLPREQLLANLGLTLKPPLEMAVLFALLVGGADRISALFKAPEASPSREATSPPLEVRGTIRLDDGPATR